jgi:di/tricarboxylate transporter
MIALLCIYQQRTIMIFGVVMLICFFTGWVNESTLLKNASNSSLMTLVLIMLIAGTIEKTSILRKINKFLFAKTEKKTLLKVMGVSVLSSSVLNNTAVVAVLIKAINNCKDVFPSRLLLPMSFATIMGGTLTLIGTSTNLVVNSMFANATHTKGFGFFDFTIVGLVVTITGCTVLYFTSSFLPKKKKEQNKFSEYVIEVEILNTSSLIGKNIESGGLRNLEDLFLVEIIRNNGQILCPVKPTDIIEIDDKLIFSGDIGKLNVLEQFSGLKLYAHKEGLNTQELTEVLIKNNSIVINKSIKEVNFRSLFDAAIVAIRRDGEVISGKLGDIRLKSGDFLLLATGTDFSLRKNIYKNFLVLKGVEPNQVLTGWREWGTILGFVSVIVFSVIFNTSLFTGLVILLAFMLISKCISLNDIRANLPLEIWLIVTSSMCIATSMESTGLASSIANLSGIYLSGHSPLIIFIGIFLVTALLTEFITNNAAAALMFPIAYSLAIGTGMNVFPVVMGVAFAASASFLTPYGYQTNLMVMNAANYKWRDFLVTGIPVSIVYIISCVVMIPLVYPL